MCNYRQCRAYLLNAFLALEPRTPEEQRFRDAIEQVLDAVTRAERDASRPAPTDAISQSNLRDAIRAARPRS